MTVTIIGAGNVATHLGKALKRIGHEIVYVYSRTLHSAEQLASAVGAKAVCDVDGLEQPTDVYFYSISDDALPTVVAAVAPRHRDSLHLHTAGSIPISVFQEYAACYGVVYPLQTFSKSRPVDMSVVPLLIEGSDEVTEKKIINIASKISNTVVKVDSEKRRKIHLTAVFACNFANHCYSLAAKIMESEQLPFDLLRPLIRETAEKIEYLHPLEAQTGPAVRYDKTVMERHIAMLDDETDKEIYRLMSQSINKEHHDKL